MSEGRHRAADDWRAFLERHPDTRFVDAFMIGLSGQVFGKREAAADLARVYESGVAFSACAAVLDVQGHGCDAQGYGGSDGDPDGICWPLPGTLAPVPWASAPTAQCLIEMRDATTGELLWFDPRKILADVVARLRADGLHPTVACELEFYLIDPKRTADGGIRPAPLARTGEVPRTALNLGMSAVEDYSEFILAVAAAAEAQGVPASTAVAEYGLGQFEINLRHVSDPVLAADHAILLKRIIQGVARARGLDATFMAKPFIDQPGNGMHVHVSMADESGRNVFAGTEGEPRLHNAIAGLQASLAESLAFFAPNFSAFRRYKPKVFVPLTGNWAHNNRSVAFRIPLGDGPARRVEHRVACADASPHLVLAAILAGIHHGMTKKLEPTPPSTGRAYSESGPPMPTTFFAALDRLVHADVLVETIPHRFLELYREVKIGEFQSLFENPTAREYDFYL
ncbi:glutamine synthetase family protein [Segnochrobactrum spirostomi]|uniref:Glutamine synthetase n=1 Tax=Segnochrobactrum spirostomi TaxID=2608987 RepID=A0A6A7Y1F9_9HYPH|nr:glutamine synthetase family protein [Segnochrobactrum spirostomi]MQT12506.1 glutamine synthetase [Segnochrobactrum spirostomi]